MTDVMRELDENRDKEEAALKELSDMALVQGEQEERAMSILSEIEVKS